MTVNIRWLNTCKFNHVKGTAHVSILLAFLWALLSISALLKKPSILSRAFYCSKLTFNGLERKNKMVWVYYVTWLKVTYWQYEFYKADILRNRYLKEGVCINQVSYNTTNIIPLAPFNIIHMFNAKNTM